MYRCFAIYLLEGALITSEFQSGRIERHSVPVTFSEKTRTQEYYFKNPV